MCALFIPMAASGITAPVTLVEVQTASGAAYFWSEQKATWPSLILAGANAEYLDWLTSAEFHILGTTETDTATLAVQNISGNTVQRDAMLAFTTTELNGALCVIRIWRGESETALLTFVGTIESVEPDESSMQISVEGFGNWSAIVAPSYNIDVTCPLTFGSVACGSTAPTPCDQTYGTCSSINRFAGVINSWITEVPDVQLAQPAPVNTFNTARAF